MEYKKSEIPENSLQRNFATWRYVYIFNKKMYLNASRKYIYLRFEINIRLNIKINIRTLN